MTHFLVRGLVMSWLSLFSTDEFWYEAEIAKHARSRCIASNCKEVIPKGELRIGVMCADKNDSHGWYHAVCLWENFGEKFNDNPRITKIEDIKNHDSLSGSAVDKIQELIDNASTSTSTTTSTATATATATATSTSTNAEPSSKRALPAEADELPPVPPYAMSGTISVKLDKNQDIHITGDVVHIGDKLKSHGAYFKEYNNIGWIFSCLERAGARRFLCMPDELPKVGQSVKLDLAELGRKHVSSLHGLD